MPTATDRALIMAAYYGTNWSAHRRLNRVELRTMAEAMGVTRQTAGAAEWHRTTRLSTIIALLRFWDAVPEGVNLAGDHPDDPPRRAPRLIEKKRGKIL